MTVSIDNIEIKIGNKTVHLTLAQLKELKAALDNLFPNPIIVDRAYPVIIPQPYQPIYPQPRPWWWSNYSGAVDVERKVHANCESRSSWQAEMQNNTLCLSTN